jgi:hypothetical protein
VVYCTCQHLHVPQRPTDLNNNNKSAGIAPSTQVPECSAAGAAAGLAGRSSVVFPMARRSFFSMGVQSCRCHFRVKLYSACNVFISSEETARSLLYGSVGAKNSTFATINSTVDASSSTSATEAINRGIVPKSVSKSPSLANLKTLVLRTFDRSYFNQPK